MRTPARQFATSRTARFLAAATAVLACGGSTACGTSGADDGVVKLGLITQLSSAPYFVAEANAATARAKQLGVELQVVDAGVDSAKVVNLTRTLITSGVDALTIVPSETAIGPRLSMMAEQAGIPLVAADSPLQDSNGNAAPFVGLNNSQAGEQVGTILSRIHGGLGWSPEDSYLGVVEAPMPACLRRTNAAYQTFLRDHPSFPDSHVVRIPYDGLASKASDSMRTTITAHPEAKHWLMVSCNDAGVVGALRALQNKNFPVRDVLGVGLGGELACQAFRTPYVRDGMRASTYLNPKAIGSAVVDRMHHAVVGKTDPPANTYIPTPEVNAGNYHDKVTCS